MAAYQISRASGVRRVTACGAPGTVSPCSSVSLRMTFAGVSSPQSTSSACSASFIAGSKPAAARRPASRARARAANPPEPGVPSRASSPATTRLAYVSSTETQVAAPNTSQSSPVGSVPSTTYTISPATSLVTKAVDPAGDTRSATYNTFNEVLTSQNANGSAGTTTNAYGANS